MSGELPDPAAGMEIPPARVKELLSAINRGQIALIDCREEDEWRFNRIEGARLVPLSGFGTAPLPDVPAIIYCHHGMRSLRAANFWRSRGRDEVWSMSGGIDRWSAEVDPGVPVY